MSIKKRANDGNGLAAPKPKRAKVDSSLKPEPSAISTKPRTEEIDFPRGGGTSLSAIEVKAAKSEAFQELRDELAQKAKSRKDKGKPSPKGKSKAGEKSKDPILSLLRADKEVSAHRLTLKNIVPGLKVLAQITSVKPLALVVSLPGQLHGHIPITNISTIYSALLDKEAASSSEDGKMDQEEPSIFAAELSEMYSVGSFVRVVVTHVHTEGEKARPQLGERPSNDEEWQCGKIELSLAPQKVNEGLTQGDLVSGVMFSAAVKSIEDHGYAMDFGLSDASGFLKFSDAETARFTSTGKLHVGMVVTCTITEKSAKKKGRVYQVTVNPKKVWGNLASEVSSLAAVGPGSLVSGLITEESPNGVRLQILGLFSSDANSWHLPRNPATRKKQKIGERVQARVLYSIPNSSPTSFSLSFLPHLLDITPSPAPIEGEDDHEDVVITSSDDDENASFKTTFTRLHQSFSRGARIDGVKVLQVHKGWGLTCAVADGVLGFVPMNNIDENANNLSEVYKVGSVHAGRVLGFSSIEGLLLLTLKSSALEENLFTADDVKVGQILKATVKSLSPTFMRVALSDKLTGIVPPIHYSDIVLKHPERKFEEGKTVKARVLAVEPSKQRIVLTLKKSLIQSELPVHSDFSEVKVGDTMVGTVWKVLNNALLVEFFGDIRGFVPMAELSDEPIANPSSHFKEGQVVKAIVIKIDNPTERKMTVSIRRALPSYVPDINNLEIGSEVRGTIEKLLPKKALLRLDGSTVRGQISYAQLAKDRKTKAKLVQRQLRTGEVITGMFVYEKDVARNEVLCSFHKPKSRQEVKGGGSGSDIEQENQDDGEESEVETVMLNNGDQVAAKVVNVVSRGIWVHVKGVPSKCLITRREIKSETGDGVKSFRKGDLIKATVLRFDAKADRYYLTLKEKESLHASAPHQDPAIEFESSNSKWSPSNPAPELPEETSDDGAEDEDEIMDAVESSGVPPTKLAQTSNADAATVTRGPGLKLGGFTWSGDVDIADDQAQSDSDSSEGEAGPSTLKKTKKKGRSAIQEDLTASMHSKTPESSAEFERLLKASPDSSFLWMQYMAFQLQLSEVDKAREIGRRALEIINFREEQEKMNVWVALLNLEIAYGTPETVQGVFTEAARANDGKAIHLRMASLLDEAGRHEEAEEMYQRTSKKFGTSSKVWTLFGEYYLRRGDADEARELLPRSLKSLEKRKHVKTVTKFAQMEYKLGDPERGRTIFEGIVDSHPKRFDLWLVYIDHEAGQGNIDSIRIIFERLLRQKLSSKKAKAAFKRWLELERSIGSEEGAETVKAKAIEWTQNNGVGSV
ncbi:rRNA biogenesis protein rrp5 [Tulasnella sp. UAMH 9824]|nr:rRNA biogenesis protein rrp5 [Tulasnella sp. UAMH 9824]